MRIRITLVWLLILMVSAVPLAAQDVACEVAVEQAVLAAQGACANAGPDQACFGNANVEAVPRYLTEDFVFSDPGDTQDLARIETFRLTSAGDDWGVTLANLSADVPVTLVMFGNVFAANNVIPTLSVDMTANTLVSIQREPISRSPATGLLVPGDTVQAIGRTDDLDGNTWVRVQSEAGNGWVQAFALDDEDALISLQDVSPEAAIGLSPMQALTFLSGVSDRPCAGVPDSGILAQTASASGESATLSVNSVAIDWNGTIYLQAQTNVSLDIYALDGQASIETGDGTQVLMPGQVGRLPLGADAQPSGMPLLLEPYPSDKLTGLGLVASALPQDVVALDGTDTATTSEVVLAEVPSVAEEVAEVPTVAEEVAEVPAVDEEVAAAPPPVVETGAASAFAEGIRQRGTVRVGVNGSLPVLSLEQDGTFTGFEPDLARAIVAELFGDGVTVEFVPVSARQRQNILSGGNLDLMIRNSSFEEGRESWGEWGNVPYFDDGQRLLVRADSGANGLADLSGQLVGALASSDAAAVLNEPATAAGVAVQAQQGTLVEVFNTLQNGSVGAITADWSTLLAVRDTAQTPSDYTVVGDLFTSVPYTVVVPPGETAFRDEIDLAINTLIQNGQWQQIYEANFVSPLPESMAAAFAPGGDVVAAAPVVEAQAAPAEVPAEEAEAPAPEETVAETPAEAPEEETVLGPVTGEIQVTVQTIPAQQRTLRISEPEGGLFEATLIRNGIDVWDGVFEYSEDGRWDNRFNSFEFMTFSETAFDESLGCERPPDVSGFINGADFEGRAGC